MVIKNSKILVIIFNSGGRFIKRLTVIGPPLYNSCIILRRCKTALNFALAKKRKPLKILFSRAFSLALKTNYEALRIII
jgi:hypothetical protein